MPTCPCLTKMPLTKENVGYIDVTRRQKCVEWTIQDYFSQSPATNEAWDSPIFHFSDAAWYLTVYPNASSDSIGYIGLFLSKKGSKIEILNHWNLVRSRTSYTLGIKARNDNVYRFYNSVQYFWVGSGYGSRQFIKISELLQDKTIVAFKDSLTFFCLITFPGDGKMDAMSQTSLSGDFEVLIRDFTNLFLSENMSDVTIKVKNKEFRAHTQILAARSPVFTSMFTHNMREKNRGVLDIDDCDPDVFREFLMYLYSGEIQGISSDNVTDLYCVAEKYDVKELETRCCYFMKNELSEDNFCDFIPFAIIHGDTELLKCAINIFLTNPNKIMATEKWKLFAKDFPEESNELLIKNETHRLSKHGELTPSPKENLYCSSQP